MYIIIIIINYSQNYFKSHKRYNFFSVTEKSELCGWGREQCKGRGSQGRQTSLYVSLSVYMSYQYLVYLVVDVVNASD